MAFATDVKKFTLKAKAKADERFRVHTLALYNDIVTGTPVDTGILQNNWQFGVGGTNGKVFSQKPGKDTSNARARATRTSKPLKITDTAVIFNNVVYADVIENGLAGTRRVPARMVAKAILMAKARNSK